MGTKVRINGPKFPSTKRGVARGGKAIPPIRAWRFPEPQKLDGVMRRRASQTALIDCQSIISMIREIEARALLCRIPCILKDSCSRLRLLS